MREGVLLQNLLDFSVQIRHRDTDCVVGTGVAISNGGQILTCAHVVRAAGLDPRDVGGAEVGVYFPQARGGEIKARRARVSACCPHSDDDIVVLQLEGGAPPLGPEQIAVLGGGEASTGHGFLSFGFSPLDPYPSRRADGKILGPVYPPAGKTVQVNPLELRSRDIRHGLSGAGVLDVERNLVVGLVAERWNPGDERLDDDVGWAVDATVLTFDPFLLALRDEPYPLRPAPALQTDVAAARAAVAPGLGACWNNAPPPLAEWVGREALLADLSADWADPGRRVTGLIGFGGEGKSSLARRWVDGLLGGGAGGPAPDGVFWWGFYERPGVDEFFEASLAWLSGGRIDPRQVPAAGLRAQIVAAMLGAGRYLFVLDGLEVMQHQEGDQYGLLRSADLRAFLGYFAAPGHGSFCLVTGRAPLLDLIDAPGYSHRDVERLSAADGRALLRRLGVGGADAALDKLVADWDGHALTLGLLGGLLAEQYGGDLAHLADLPAPLAGEARYERVHRVLRRYDEHLSEAERAFLTLFSAFRTPVSEAAFDKVFRAETGSEALNAPLARLKDGEFRALVERLVAYRLLRYTIAADGHGGAGEYSAHPLVRAHYFARLTAGNRAEAQDAHARIKDYYLKLAGDTPQFPSLEDLKPLIEVVHHACRAGAYDEAHRIRRERIDQRNRYVLTQQLGADETELAIMLEFFPGGDASGEPQVSEPGDKRWILNEVGLCLTSLGRLGEAAPYYERYVTGNIAAQDWHNASIGYQNLADLHAHLGALEASAAAAREALALARRAGNKGDERNSLAWEAWAAHLRGDGAAAAAAFAQAEALEREITPQVRSLYSQRGIQHADYLRRAGEAEAARRVTEANLAVCQQNRWPNDLSQCHRVLGDLDAGAGQQAGAREHYDAALKIARSITRRDVLIEALLARGRWAARHGAAAPAAADLDEALGYALAGGYRIYEADIRAALAWAHLAGGATAAGRAEAGRARQMSADMGYHWGVVDADEALRALGVKGCRE